MYSKNGKKRLFNTIQTSSNFNISSYKDERIP